MYIVAQLKSIDYVHGFDPLKINPKDTNIQTKQSVFM